MEALREQLRREGVLMLQLRVRPGAAHTELVGVLADGSLKIRVHAAPEDGKANEELVRFLSDALSVPLRNISIVTGAGNRRKTVRVVTHIPGRGAR